MFAVREYAVCIFAVVLLAATLAAACGIGYLVKLVTCALLRAARRIAMSHVSPTKRSRPRVTAPAGIDSIEQSAAARFLGSDVRRSAASALAVWPAIVALTMLSASAQQVAPAAPAYTFNVSVNEVVLHATVRNHNGAPVDDLAKENFQIFEDGVMQSIRHYSHQDIPVTIGFVIDNSGSMRPKRAEVVAASLAFAGSSNPQDEMFLVNFNEHVRFGLPANIPFTDQQDQLRAAMKTVLADGKTALYDAVAVALEHLKQGKRDKKVLIVVSDGADNASTHTKAQALALATQSDAIIYAVGIYEPDDPDRSPGVLRELAKSSGGEAFFPASLAEVTPICERIAREIRNQYTLSYASTNRKQDGTYRRIQLRAATPGGHGLAVTTRAGYVAPLHSVAGNGAGKPEARE